MSLSRQNSLRVREASAQDRLVVTSDNMAAASGAQASGAICGGAAKNYDDKEVPFLQRSESCLSSHMSSPDIFTATSQDQGLPHGYRSTHVVELQDIHARVYDHARRQVTKQQLQDKAAQRRSWHFDERNGAYVLTDLINSRPEATLPSLARTQRETEGVKPPVPPRRDKLTTSSNSNRLSGNPAVSPIQEQTPDLMVLIEPVVEAADKEEQSTHTLTMTDVPVTKRNTNPFIEDDAAAPSEMSDLHNRATSGVSWQNQPWPDPPTYSEITDQTAPTVPNSNNNTVPDGSTSTTLTPQLKSVPESLQYQPQNYTNRSTKHSQDQDSKTPYGTLKSNDSHIQSSKGTNFHIKHQHGRKGASKEAPPPPPLEAQVPIRKEYDNPLFKTHPPDVDRPGTLGENFSLQICESTSFVNPSPEEPMPPSYYAAVGTSKSESSTKRRHSGHYNYSPILEDRECTVISGQPHVDKTRSIAPPSYTRSSNHSTEDAPKKHIVSKEKSRFSDKQLQHQNGIVKSRPRQVKREHQQRRSGHPDVGNLQQQPSSPHGGRYGSSPDLVSKSPRQGQRRPDSAGAVGGPGYGQEDYNRNVRSRTKTPDRFSGVYAYDTCRQPQSTYQTAQPGHYSHWVDSDL